MLSEFKAFIARGNVMDLAVGVIIGAAFGKIVSSLTDDVIMPLIGFLNGGIDFTNKFVVLGSIPPTYKGGLNNYAELKKGGVAMLGYGSFITAIINFLLMAIVIFVLVRQVNRMMPPAAPASAGPSEVELLTEIRDSLKKG